MVKKMKYIAGLAILSLVAYNSVYFKKLNEVKAVVNAGKFDAVSFTTEFWNRELKPALTNGLELSYLIELLNKDPEKAFQNHSNALGIGNIRYFLVKGEGVVLSVNANDVVIQANAESQKLLVKLATEFVYGNEVRDALGLIDINEFDNITDFNNISAEINKKIRNEVIPPFLAEVREGKTVRFTGALELNKMHLNLNEIEVIPVALAVN